MRMFIDKYRPECLGGFKFNSRAVEQLSAIAPNDNVPHLIIQGNSGSGKKTVTNLYLKEREGVSSLGVRTKLIELKCSSGKIEVLLIYSPYHCQINPSAHGVHDRLIFLNFIKILAQHKSLNRSGYRVIVVENADNLTMEAQHSLRRILEEYVGSCRFIFQVTNECGMIPALRSRCIKVRLRTPKATELRDELRVIANAEGYPHDNVVDRIAESCGSNFKKSLHYLQLCILSGKREFNLDDMDPTHLYIDRAVNYIFNGDNLHVLLDIRETVYDLLTHCVDPVLIIRQILKGILSKISDKYFGDKHNLIKAANRAEHTLKMGSKPIYHVEGFTVSAFKLIKTLQLSVQNSTRGAKRDR